MIDLIFVVMGVTGFGSVLQPLHRVKWISRFGLAGSVMIYLMMGQVSFG